LIDSDKFPVKALDRIIYIEIGIVFREFREAFFLDRVGVIGGVKVCL
jgi:hypothetical protein